jgi:hypothetical protein
LPVYRAVTDDAGKFLIEGIASGSYLLSAKRAGFIPGLFGARGQNKVGIQLTLNQGEVVRGIKVFLTPQAEVSGRVVDEDGEPTAGVLVAAVAWAGPLSQLEAARFARPQATSATDDRGEYRLSGIAPGKFVLCVVPPLELRSTIVEKDGGRLGYVPFYAPDTLLLEQASLLDVAPGSVVSGNQITLFRTDVSRVSGQVVDATGRPVRDYSLLALPAQNRSPLVAPILLTRGPEGKFSLDGMPPGSYHVLIRAQHAQQEVGALEQLDLGRGPIEDFRVAVLPTLQVRGRFIVDGRFTAPPPGLAVTLTGDPPLPPITAYPDESGAFELSGLFSGTYRVTIGGLKLHYLEDIYLGEQTILGQSFQLANSASQMLVRLASGGGHVSGTLTKEGEAVAGSLCLIPTAGHLRVWPLIRQALADQRSLFEFSHVRPGSYYLLSTSTARCDSLISLEALDAKSVKRIDISTGSTEKVELNHEE